MVSMEIYDFVGEFSLVNSKISRKNLKILGKSESNFYYRVAKFLIFAPGLDTAIFVRYKQVSRPGVVFLKISTHHAFFASISEYLRFPKATVKYEYNKYYTKRDLNGVRATRKTVKSPIRG